MKIISSSSLILAFEIMTIFVGRVEATAPALRTSLADYASHFGSGNWKIYVRHTCQCCIGSSRHRLLCVLAI